MDKGLGIKKCGKLIIPQRIALDPQLDILYDRGKRNGAVIEFINSKEIEKLVPDANITSGRAIWSPNTAVVDPKKVIQKIPN